jgi:hypothetical protein
MSMGSKTIVSLLAGYFNQGGGKRALSEFQQEIKALSVEEKRELAEGICAITGDTIKG